MGSRLSLRAMPIIAFARKFALIFMLICSFNFNSIVFGAERYVYNTSWEDNYLGTENIRLILDHFNYEYNDNDVFAIYDAFINSYSAFKNEYSNIKLYNIMFWQQQSTLSSYTGIYYTIGNGTFADNTVPYIFLQYSSETRDNIKWTNDVNSSGTTNKQAYLGGSSLINYQGNIATSNFSVTQVDNNYYLNGKIFSYFPTYTIVYHNNFGFLENNLDGLLIAENEFLSNPFLPEPETPSGDNNENVSSQITQIQGALNNIENKIPSSGDIQGIISGETDKVINFMSGDADFNKEYTSGEILEKIDFTPIENPTANFWYELTQILNNALTGSGGNVVFKWFGNEYTITPEMINPPYPEELRVLLTTVSTVVVIFIIAKWIKIIADTSQGGNLDQLLEMNEEGIVNLF